MTALSGVSFGELGVGINRRRITPITAPALTRHVAIWLRADTSAGEADTSDSRRRRFDRLLHHVYLTIRRYSADVRAFDTNSWNDDKTSILLFGSTLGVDQPNQIQPVSTSELHRAIKFLFTFDNVPVTLAFDIHEEIATITWVVDCSQYLTKDEQNSELAKSVAGALTTIDRRAAWREVEMHGASSAIYDGVWRRVGDLLVPDTAIDAIGEVLLDGRGLILAPQPRQAEMDEVALVRPFELRKSDESTAPARISEAGIELKATSIGSILPVLTCRSSSNVEYTLSHLMGERALYASCLGSGPDTMGIVPKRPITFLLLADAHNSWQLGRLVYRIHRAGVARIAATKHFHALRGLSGELRNVERELEDALSKSASAETTDEEHMEVVRTVVRPAYQSIESTLKKILQYGDDEALTYRVDRSRFYVRQFQRATEALRIKRVEGFQPYDEFVEQRQGSAFALIDLLGQRYARVQRDRALLLRRIQVFNAQINEREIRLAQTTADIALFLILGPYYAGHVAHELASPWLGGDHSLASRTLWAGILALGVSFFVARRRREHGARWRRIGMAVTGAVAATGLFYVAAAALTPAEHGPKGQATHMQAADQ